MRPKRSGAFCDDVDAFLLDAGEPLPASPMTWDQEDLMSGVSYVAQAYNLRISFGGAPL